jgi:L-rhamnose mutarotase
MGYLNPNESLYIAPYIRCELKKDDFFLIFEDTQKEIKLDSLSSQDLLRIFQATIYAWYFKPIQSFLNCKTEEKFFKGVIVLQSLLPIIELIGQIKEGQYSYQPGESKKLFKEGFKLLFNWGEIETDKNLIYYICNTCDKKLYETPEGEKLLKLIYNHIRNGLIHNGIFKAGVKFSFYYDSPIEIEIENKGKWYEAYELNNIPSKNIKNFGITIKINPNTFFEYLKNGFNEFLRKIENDKNYKKNFQQMFTELQGKLKTCYILGEFTK